MWFWRKTKTREFSRHDALATKPMRLVEPEIVDLGNGSVKLKVKLKSGGAKRWIFRLPEGATKTFELDSLGLMVWESCDGRTSVQQIIRKLARTYKLNLREAEVPTVRFLQTLVKKGLIGMAVPSGSVAGPKS